MAENLTRKLIAAHLIDGEMTPGSEIALRIDQILLHDTTGPLCALELEAMGLDDIKAPLAVAYTDHLLLEADHRNADVKGPNHAEIPHFEPIPDEMEIPVLLTFDDHITTDAIMPAGIEGMSLWSNLPGMTEYAFHPVDDSYVQHARDTGDHAIVAGRNYGQGSSREQAALAPRALGLRVVVAGNIARIHAENLVNFGVLPLTFTEPKDRQKLKKVAKLRINQLRSTLRDGPGELDIHCDDDQMVHVRHDLSSRQVDILFAGGSIPWKRHQLDDGDS